MAGRSLTLYVGAGEYAIARLAPDAPVPSWAYAAGFCSVTRTANELSVLCPSEQVPLDTVHERGWALLQLEGPMAFTLTGVLASVLAPLAAAGVSILAMATFETDYVFVRHAQLSVAVEALEGAGHVVRRADHSSVLPPG